MKSKILLSLILLLTVFTFTSCENTEPTPEPDYKYVIITDDGNDNGVMSRTNYKAISYEMIGEKGVKFITSDGKEHFTTYKVDIRER